MKYHRRKPLRPRKRARGKTPIRTDEYRQLLRLLAKVDLEIAPGISLPHIIDQILEGEVEARIGFRKYTRFRERQWMDHRKAFTLTAEAEVTPPNTNNVMGI